MLSKRELKSYKAMLSDILQLECPEVIFDDSLEGTACLVNAKIYINASLFEPDEEFDLNYFIRYGIAHEFRHHWQMYHNGVAAFEKYYEKFPNYELNPMEIDANAFAALIMVVVYGYESFTGISPESYPYVDQRMSDIYDNEHPTSDIMDRYRA